MLSQRLDNMTIVMIKDCRCQTLLLNGLEDPPPPIFYDGDIEIEILDTITVTLCSED